MKFVLESYRSYYAEPNFVFKNAFVGAMNFIVNIFLSLSAIIYECSVYIISILNDDSILLKISEIFTNNIENVVQILEDNFLSFIFVVVLVTALYYFLTLNFSKILNVLIVFIFTLFALRVYASNSSLIIDNTFDLINSVNKNFTTAINASIATDNKTVNTDDNVKFFEIAYRNAWSIINFGKIISYNENEDSEVGEEVFDYNGRTIRVYDFLVEKDLSSKEKSERYDAIEPTANKMTISSFNKSTVSSRIIMSIVNVFNTIMMCSFYIINSFTIFFMKIMILFAYYILPFISILSLIPFFNAGFMKVIKTILSYSINIFLMLVFIGFTTTVIFVIENMNNGGLVTFVGLFVVKAVFLYVIMRSKNVFFNLFGFDKVSHNVNLRNNPIQKGLRMGRRASMWKNRRDMRKVRKVQKNAMKNKKMEDKKLSKEKNKELKQNREKGFINSAKSIGGIVKGLKNTKKDIKENGMNSFIKRKINTGRDNLKNNVVFKKNKALNYVDDLKDAFLGDDIGKSSKNRVMKNSIKDFEKNIKKSNKTLFNDKFDKNRKTMNISRERKLDFLKNKR